MTRIETLIRFWGFPLKRTLVGGGKVRVRVRAQGSKPTPPPPNSPIRAHGSHTPAHMRASAPPAAAVAAVGGGVPPDLAAGGAHVRRADLPRPAADRAVPG